MDRVCVQHETTLPDMEEFKKAMEPAIRYFQNNCNPHQRIIIEMDGAELVSGEMAYSVEVPD